MQPSDMIGLYDVDGKRVGTCCVSTGRAQIGSAFYAPERACRAYTRSCYEEDYGIWATECGGIYQFDHGTPLDHWTFCPNCSGRLVSE